MTDMSDAQTAGDDPLSITVDRHGDTTIVAVAGELDLHTSDQLTQAVGRALDTGPTAVELEASGLRFADSAGLRALLVARDDAQRRGATLRLTEVSEPLDRLLEMTGLRDVLVTPAPG
jgi:anti-sigma B factor antagonist